MSASVQPSAEPLPGETMTSRERILATLRHERPDRVPLDGWFRPETAEALADRLGKDWRACLGIDPIGSAAPGIRFPEWEARTDLEAKKGYWPGAGARYRWHDERTFEDVFGIVHRIGEDGKYCEWVSGPLKDVDPESREARERLETIIPDYEFRETPEELAARVKGHVNAGRFTRTGIPLPFKMAWMLRGMENLLCDYLVNPEFAHELMDRLYAFYGAQVRRAAEAGADLVTVTGDIASQDRLMFSHQVFDEYIKPRMKALVVSARECAAAGRLHFFYHCDGDMSSVLPDFIDDLEFDIINPIQPECMDCYKVKAEYGGRVTLHGTISVVDLLPNGPAERIRRVVRERIDRLAYNGGFMMSSANVITYDTPLDHVLAMYGEARNYTSGQWPES
jgi:uroporphyrinogen decarboxylase